MESKKPKGKAIKLFILTLASVIFFIPVLLVGFMYLTSYVIYSEMVFIMARIAQWSGRPDIALQWIESVAK